jgi:methionyl aminopeptidase
MSIESQQDLTGLQAVSEAVGLTLKKMRDYCRPGMSTLELDEYGGTILRSFGAQPAPRITYGFPGYTCISLNTEVAHGIPSANAVLKEGDLINIDVSAELGGYFSDNGGSFVLGNDLRNLNPLISCSKRALQKALSQIRGGVKISQIGALIENEARRSGFRVIRNLAGHGIGRSLHEQPHDLLCYPEQADRRRFRKNTVVALETFISTRAIYVHEKGDGWTLVTRDGSFVAQHEHTILITEGKPVVLTAANGI